MMDVNIKKDVYVAAKGLLSIIPKNTGQCTYLSASLHKYLNSLNIETEVVIGSLTVNNYSIYKCNKYLDIEDKYFDGHCWLETDNLIIDISIVRSINSETDDDSKNILNKFSSEIENFNEIPEDSPLIFCKDYIKLKRIKYEKKFTLDSKDINSLDDMSLKLIYENTNGML